MKIDLPAQSVHIDTPSGVDATWFQKLQQMAAGFGRGLLPVTATSGFCYMPTCAGAPTGIPAGQAGFAPFVFDVTNNKLWIYNPITLVWKGVVLT
jgi:hypothetical protein